MSEFQIRFVEGGKLFTAFIIRPEDIEEKCKHLPVLSLTKDDVTFSVGLKDTGLGDPDVPTGRFERPEVSFTKYVFPATWVASMLKMAHLT